ncbi:uncharacterized protein [Clytia hemisphaerica]|uniref:uncharacterized protein n=1 Tax=Clytia hemisphaerica TaxID=252671 RepID=UPI0034D424D0
MSPIHYHDVIIEQNRLLNIPEDAGIIPGLPIVSANKFNNENKNEDKGPAPGQFEKLAVDEELTTASGFATQLTNSDADENVKNALRAFLGDNANVEEILEAGQVADIGRLHLNKREKPIPELSTDGFFTMCYPHIFVNGTCDYTIKAARTLKYEDWVQHICYCNDNRVPAHRFLKFHLMNISMRKKALDQGSFCVNQQINEKHITRDELLEQLENQDEAIPRKFLSFSANLIDTAPYWRERKHELDSFCFFMLKEHQVYPTYFDTSSCAEHHWIPLHNILIKYLSQITGDLEADLQVKFKSDSKFRHQVLLQNQHIVTSYFDARHHNYINTVLKELFQYEEFWSRYEFAKSRGQIHSHSLFFSKQHYDKVKAILSQDKNDPTVNIAKDLETWLQTNEMNDTGVFSPGFVSLHPAGGEVQHNDDQTPQWVPNKQNWPLPEGSLTDVDANVLKKCVLCQGDDEELKAFHTDLVNKVMLHTCSSYCLRRKTVTTKEKDQDGKPIERVIRYCRHHFGEYDEKSKRSTGKEINPFEPRITEGKISRFEGRNDHPRMVQHILLRPLTWLAQCDTQAIVTDDLLALIKYITGYCCKGNKSTQDLMDIYKEILNKSDPTISLKSVAQKLLLKTVGFVDTPSSAADYINTKGKLYSCSRRFKRIGLSGFRLFDPNGKDGKVTKDTIIDKFLSDKRREENPYITLYDWAKKCDCAKKSPCNKDHVPVFTGCQRFWIWPAGEDFSKELLMKFSPGTWRKVDDLKNGFDTYTESFAQFLDSDYCPESVRMMLQFAKAEYDKKVARRQKRQNNQPNQPIEEINFSQSTLEGSQDSQSSQGSVVDTMGNQLLRDIARENRLSIEEASVDEEVLYNGGIDYDWHANGLMWLGVQSFPDTLIEETKNWLSDVSKQANEAFEREGRLCTLPDVDPKLVNPIQMLIVNYNIQLLLDYARGNFAVGYEHCKRLIVQGCAGTGKSQVVKIITRLVRRIFKCNRSVLNVAPTSAAGILLPDGGTIHSCVNIPRKTKGITFDSCPMNSDQIKHLKSLALDNDGKKLSLMCLNADERGMVGQYVLGWFHQRFSQLSINLLDRESDQSIPFGCIPTFNFFGDIFQLRAIGERNLYDIVLDSTDPIDSAGGFAFKDFQDVFILEEKSSKKSS